MGKLYLNGHHVCETLERPFMDNKRNVSCIPKGVYDVRFRYRNESASRDYVHLIVKEVPNRSFILFHYGNKVSDSQGCIMTGMGRNQENETISNSRKAHHKLMDELIEIGQTDNIELVIKNK